MSPTLVFIGAAAGLVPAESLRALASGGTVFVPEGIPADLDGVIREAVEAGGGAIVPFDAAGDLSEVAGGVGAGGGLVAVAGTRGPQLARALRARVPAAVSVPDGPAFDDALLGQELVSLKRIVDVLRVECPWDREQTPADIIAYTVEEVYELADAIADGDLGAERGELGDLLLQVVLLALMLSEQEAGNLGLVAHEIEAKLIRRHPHIFADAVAETAAEVKGRWERIKVEQEGRRGIFHDVPRFAPALLHARKLQQRAASVGFDWPSAAGGFHKIAEEHDELAELFAEAASSPGAADPDRHDPRVVHEVGDLLFAVVNVARLLHVDPELALRETSRRFERRVSTAAAIAASEGREWSALDLVEQEAYYQRAKGGETAEAADTE
jgi:nucleoside triphosphate diphosphatase